MRSFVLAALLGLGALGFALATPSMSQAHDWGVRVGPVHVYHSHGYGHYHHGYPNHYRSYSYGGYYGGYSSRYWSPYSYSYYGYAPRSYYAPSYRYYYDYYYSNPYCR
jgi:hypothetical protein